MHTLSSAPGLLVALTVLFGFGVAWAATGLVRRYALARSILDVPNHRSSHTISTPRGGGAAIVSAFLAGLVALFAAGAVRFPVLAGIGGGSLAIALIGWLDDRRGVAARWRFLVQLAAAAWALAWLGGLPSLTLGTSTVALGLAGWIPALVGIVWYANLFNFMDGIDGIAGGQAVTAGVFGAVLLWLGGSTGLASISLLVAATSAGFLLWNWSPARIFMGDVGSSMLGFVFATLAVAGENAGAVALPVALLLGAPFVLDTTLTLVRRLARGEKWYEAHRSHAYQRAVQSGLTHAQVSSFIIAANVVLGAAAIATQRVPSVQLVTVVAGFLVLLGIYAVVEHRLPMPSRDVRSAVPAEANE